MPATHSESMYKAKAAMTQAARTAVFTPTDAKTRHVWEVRVIWSGGAGGTVTVYTRVEAATDDVQVHQFARAKEAESQIVETLAQTLYVVLSLTASVTATVYVISSSVYPTADPGAIVTVVPT